MRFQTVGHRWGNRPEVRCSGKSVVREKQPQGCLVVHPLLAEAVS